MEELRDASIHHTAIKLFSDIKSMKLYDNLFKTVQVYNENTITKSNYCVVIRVRVETGMFARSGQGKYEEYIRGGHKGKRVRD